MPQFDETWLMVMSLSLLSGTGVFFQGVRGQKHEASVFNFLAECVSAITAGLIILYLARYQGWDESLLFAAILLLGNNATELMDRGRSKFLNMLFGSERGDKTDGA